MGAEERAIILVVEDDPGTARLYQKRLERAGYQVLLATDATAALAIIRQQPVDLLLLDQHLPGGVSGLDLYHQARTEGVEVPAVLVTGMAGEAIVVESIRAGLQDFIPKTGDYLDYLLPAIDRILSKRRKEMEAAYEMMAAAARENARLCEELRRADQLKDEFLAMLAHELRNPLAPIRNALHLTRLADFQPEVVAQNWAILERQVTHLVRLVEDLLDVSRINQGKINLQKERVEVASIVARALESSHPLIEARRHMLNVDVPPEPLLLEGDPIRLVQVLSNLLNNAAKYTPEGGRIELAAERVVRPSEPPEWVRIRVRDNGVGILAEMLPRLFELFAQQPRTLNRADGGLGIGLTLVRHLVTMHGGEVQAASAGPGQGSEFVVLLPLAPLAVESSKELVPSAPEQAASTSAGRRVLIVDDHVDSGTTLGRLLALLGHEIRLIHDGAETLSAAVEFQPDVILLDIGLPGLDGYEAARRLRADGRFNQVVLVAVTGYGSPEDRQQSHDVGFNAHLVKPVDLVTLKHLLEAPQTLLRGDRPSSPLP